MSTSVCPTLLSERIAHRLRDCNRRLLEASGLVNLGESQRQTRQTDALARQGREEEASVLWDLLTSTGFLPLSSQLCPCWRLVKTTGPPAPIPGEWPAPDHQEHQDSEEDHQRECQESIEGDKMLALDEEPAHSHCHRPGDDPGAQRIERHEA